MARNSSISMNPNTVVTRIWWTVIVVLMWVGIVVVADLNWPSHMGEQGALLKAIGIL